MKRYIILTALLFTTCEKEEILSPEPTPDNAELFTEIDFFGNVVYGSSTTQSGITEDLLMDIYTPQGDISQSRPLIILAHGGGFLGGDKESMMQLSSYLSRRGFVVASLKYRLVDVEETPDAMKRGVIDAMFDMRAAVRYFRKDLANSNTYRIDTNNIFIGGYSAGAFMGLHTAYVNSLDEIIEIGGQSLLDYVNSSGGLEGNSGNDGYSSNIRAAISLSGALAKADLIDAGEPILFSFHGTADSVVPYLTGESDGSGVTTDGPGVYHSVADEVGIINQLITIQNGDHGVFWETNGSEDALIRFITENLID